MDKFADLFCNRYRLKALMVWSLSTNAPHPASSLTKSNLARMLIGRHTLIAQGTCTAHSTTFLEFRKTTAASMLLLTIIMTISLHENATKSLCLASL